MTRYGTVIIVGLVLTVLFKIFMFANMTTLSFINAISMTSIVLFVIGAVLFIVEGGIFYGITYSFKRFFKKTAKAAKIRDEFADDDKDDDYEPKTYSFSYTYPFIVTSVVLFLVLLGISYFLL